MELTTEYLIIIEKNASPALYQLCDSVQEFNKLLSTPLSSFADPDSLPTWGASR